MGHRRGAAATQEVTRQLSVATRSLESIQIIFSSQHVPANEFVLRDADLVVRVVVADGIERGLRVVVGDAQQEHAAESRLLRTGGQQQPVGFQLA